MQLETIRYQADSGWLPESMPEMDSEHTLVLLFGAAGLHDDTTPFAAVRQAYPSSCIIGCSTSGEIDSIDINDNTIIGAVIRFDNTELRRASARIESAAQSTQAGQKIARQLLRDDLRAILVLSDGIHVNGSQLVAGFNEVLPASVVVTGGLAGDGDRFARTWTLHDGLPTSGEVCAVGLYGDRVRVGHGSRGGWDIFGPERKVTRSRDNVLYELDGKPALELYKRYLGDRASELPAAALLFPLSLRSNSDDQKSIVRTILAIDEDEQSMTFAGDVPEGSLAQLMRANFDRLINASSEAAAQTRESIAASPPRSETAAEQEAMLAIAISCVGRRLVLGERTEEELEVALESMPKGTVQIGFYSYGEISPFAPGTCDLHNQTMTLTTISER